MSEASGLVQHEVAYHNGVHEWGRGDPHTPVETKYLPSASTCMHLLKLPMFRDKETMREAQLCHFLRSRLWAQLAWLPCYSSDNNSIPLPVHPPLLLQPCMGQMKVPAHSTSPVLLERWRGTAPVHCPLSNTPSTSYDAADQQEISDLSIISVQRRVGKLINFVINIQTSSRKKQRDYWHFIMNIII